MRQLLRRLLSLPAARASHARGARPDASVFAIELQDRRALPGTLRRLSPPGDFSQPMVNRTGTRVAFWGVAHGHAVPAIWVSRLACEASAAMVSGSDGIQGHPYWHPDGVRLVHFDSKATTWEPGRQFSPHRHPAQLWWLDTDSRESRQLTDGPHIDERPAVAPDGRTVVFASNRSGRLNLWRVNEDGSSLSQLTDGPGPDYRPCISPDGRWLAYFSATTDGSHQVRVRSLATGKEQHCYWTRLFAWSHGPFWCPDGFL
jgi:Tol biopolymer transport system component